MVARGVRAVTAAPDSLLPMSLLRAILSGQYSNNVGRGRRSERGQEAARPEPLTLFSLVVFSEARRLPPPGPVATLPSSLSFALRSLPSWRTITAPATTKQTIPTVNVTTSRIRTPLAAARTGTHQMAKSPPDPRVLGSTAM